MNMIDRKDLFRSSSLYEKLDHLQALLEKNELTAPSALAILKVIHDELSLREVPDRAGLRRYAFLLAAFEHAQPELFHQVAEDWQTHKRSLT